MSIPPAAVPPRRLLSVLCTRLCTAFKRPRALLGLGLVGAALASGAAFHYANSDGSHIDKPLWEVLKWSWSRPEHAGLPRQPLPVLREPAGTAAARPGELSVTWIGHATALLRMDGATVLTDPHFSERASPVSWAGPKRMTPLPYPPEQLPHIDVVLISHNHYDHLDSASLRTLAQQPGGPPLFVVPSGLEPWMADEGLGPVLALAWWQGHSLPSGLRIHAVPAWHWSARGLWDRHQSHWAGWVLHKGGRSAYYAGDTGYSGDFARIGQRFPGLELALIPVGAYEPRWFMRDQHVNPAEAVQIHRDVGARYSLGVHWGTFPLADDTPEQAVADLAAALHSQQIGTDQFRLLRHGQTWDIGTAP